MENKKDYKKLIGLAIITIILIISTVLLFPYVLSLKEEANRIMLQEYINSKGIWGVFILLAIQVLQVVVALIPGEFVEIISGLLYGTVGGYLICTVGMLIGTAIIYYTVKVLGYSAINKKLGDGKLSKFKFLNDASRVELLTFILFFIPGTPKDLLTYFMPFVKIKPSKFFFISTVARIPTIVSSTFAGRSISQGKWGQTILVFVIIGVFSIAGIIVNNILTKRLNEKKQKKENKLV